MSISKASATWEGDLKTGTGAMIPGNSPPVSFSRGTRFEGVKGSNPEELIGAALSGCFSMALSAGLSEARFTPKRIHTSCDVHLDKVEGGFSITKIALRCEADVPGAEDAKFQEIAAATKKGCPVSKALSAVEITLDAKLLHR